MGNPENWVVVMVVGLTHLLNIPVHLRQVNLVEGKYSLEKVEFLKE